MQFKVGASATFVGLVHPANTYAFYNTGFSNDPSVDKNDPCMTHACVRFGAADPMKATAYGTQTGVSLGVNLTFRP